MNGACYDCLMSPLERGLIERVREQLLGGLRGRVLDLGAGTGANFSHFSTEAQVLAVEPDPDMFDRARARAGANIELREGVAEHLPVADAWADHVVATLVLCTVADQSSAFAEIARVLKPGGTLHFLEHVRAEGVVGLVNDFCTPLWKRVAGGCRLNRRTLQGLAQAGFVIERVEVPFRLLGTPFVCGTATYSGV